MNATIKIWYEFFLKKVKSLLQDELNYENKISFQRTWTHILTRLMIVFFFENYSCVKIGQPMHGKPNDNCDSLKSFSMKKS